MLLLVAIIGAACGDDDDRASSTATSTASGRPGTSRSVTPTPTASPNTAFSTENAMAHLNKLAVEIGVRAGGTEGELRGAEYIRDQLRSFGYEAELQEFPIEIYQGLNVRLEPDDSSELVLRPTILSGSASGDVSGRILYAGIGEPGEFPGDTSGAIALIERGELTFTEKVANAEAAGAVGVVIYNNVDGPFEGALSQGEPTSLPVVALPREDGLALLGLVEGRGATGRLVVEVLASEGTSYNVIAREAGGDCRVIAGGHLDSVPDGPGANDNGSGTATVLELARVLAARGEMSHVCIVLFGAEELGLLGSAHYAAQLSEDERQAIVGMLNFDMFGVGADWTFIGSTSMVQLAGEEAGERGIPYRLSGEPPGGGSDHASFIAYGIPAVLFNCFCDPNYHTAADRIEFILPERLDEAGNIGIGVAEALLEQVAG